MQPSKEGSCASVDKYTPPAPGEPQQAVCGLTRTGRNGSNTTIDGHGLTMDAFPSRMSWDVATGKHVINKTGLAGLFDIHLEYAPPPARQPHQMIRQALRSSPPSRNSSASG